MRPAFMLRERRTEKCQGRILAEKQRRPGNREAVDSLRRGARHVVIRENIDRSNASTRFVVSSISGFKKKAWAISLGYLEKRVTP